MEAWIGAIRARINSKSVMSYQAEMLLQEIHDMVNSDSCRSEDSSSPLAEDEIGIAPPTPPTDSPILLEADVTQQKSEESCVNETDDCSKEEVALKSEDDASEPKESTGPEDASTQVPDFTVGIKVSSLDSKMSELAALMQKLDQLSKDELPVVHDMLRMVYLLLQKERSSL